LNNQYEVIFEFKIRLLRPKPSKGLELDWALASLGIDELGVEIYKILLNREAMTLDEIATMINREKEEIIDALDTLYSLGLIEKLGNTYFISKDLPSSIRTRTTKIIEKVLNDIAKTVEQGR